MRLVGQVPGIVDNQSHWTCWGRWPRALRSSRGLAEAQHPSAPLHPTGDCPRATGSIPGLPGSSLDQLPEKTDEVGQDHGLWGSGGPGEGAGPDANSQGPWAFSAFPYTRCFLCPFFINFLLWKNISLYKSRENSRMNHRVPINCYQLMVHFSPPLPKYFKPNPRHRFITNISRCIFER